MGDHMEVTKAVKVDEWVFAITRDIFVLPHLQGGNWCRGLGLPSWLSISWVKAIERKRGIVTHHIQAAIGMECSCRVVAVAKSKVRNIPGPIHRVRSEQPKGT